MAGFGPTRAGPNPDTSQSAGTLGVGWLDNGSRMNEIHNLTLTKPSKRRLREDVIKGNLESLLASTNNRSLTVAGWTLEPHPIGDKGLPFDQKGTEGAWTYEAYVKVSYQREDDKQPDPNVFKSICHTVYTKANQNANGRWILSWVDGDDYEPFDPTNTPLSSDFVGYAQLVIPDNFEENFTHLFGLDSHIARIKRALQAGEMSGWNNRYNCVLIGPPGCGKSDICQTVKRTLGDEAVLEFDATALTAAGAIKELSEREILPRVLLVEEIEKGEEKMLSFLLSVLDLRSEIRKTTARATIQRDTKLFAVATVNNDELFNKVMSGAVASRFPNTIWFKRPDRDQLKMILEREVTKVAGDFAWIEPTLDYCEQQRITDPRMVNAICLCGRDMLVSGAYQKMLTDTMKERPVAVDWTSRKGAES